MNEKEIEFWKEKIIYWLFGEIKFKNRWKILMWSIQTLAILILFYVVVLTDEFKDNKTVKEIKPLLDALKSGEYYLTKNPQCADITFNASNLYFRPVNYTAPNPYPTPTPR